jgi:hypothetical protein
MTRSLLILLINYGLSLADSAEVYSGLAAAYDDAQAAYADVVAAYADAQTSDADAAAAYSNALAAYACTLAQLRIWAELGKLNQSEYSVICILTPLSLS